MNDGSFLLETAEEELHKISAGMVLDVATGSGGFITFLVDNLKEYQAITGIDCNERQLEAARKIHALENIHFQRMDAERIGFPDQRFDTVVMANSLHHMKNLPTVLSEMKRVCKPGGRFIISEMYRDNQSEAQLTHVYLHHWWAAIDTAEGITHHETFTRQELVELFEKMGLRNLEYFELSDLESDPKEAEMIKELDGIIDRYIQRAQALYEGTELSQRGEQLRQRVHEVGFRGATSLFMIAENNP